MHCQIAEYLATLTSKQSCTCGHAVRCRHSLMKSVVTTVGPSSSASPSCFSACLPSSKPLIASDNTCRKSWLYRHPADAVLLQFLHGVCAVLRVTLQALRSMHGQARFVRLTVTTCQNTSSYLRRTRDVAALQGQSQQEKSTWCHSAAGSLSLCSVSTSKKGAACFFKND